MNTEYTLGKEMNLNTIPETKEDVMIMSTEDFNKRMYANFADNIKSILSAHNYFLAEYKAKQHFRKFTDFTEAMDYVTSMCPKGTDAMYQMYESVANTLNFKHSMTIYIQDKETFANDCSEGCTTVVVHGDDTHWYVPSSLPRIVAARMRKAMKHGYENILFEYYPRYVHTANPDTGLVNSYPDVESLNVTITDETHESKIDIDGVNKCLAQHNELAFDASEGSKLVPRQQGNHITTDVAKDESNQ